MAWEQQTITTVTAGSQLHKALLSIGLQPTDSCIVHTRMSAFGFIPGGGTGCCQRIEGGTG